MSHDAEVDGDLGVEHSQFWGDLADVITSEEDLTFSQLETIEQLLDGYISGGNQMAELNASETAAYRTAKRVQTQVEEMLEVYRGDPHISQGTSARSDFGSANADIDPTERGDSPSMFTGGGQRSIRRNQDSFKTTAVQEYVSARRQGGMRSQQQSGMRSEKPGRTQINHEATFFKRVESSLDKEIREAKKRDDNKTATALTLLQRIMSRQESGKTGAKRTNAGTVTASQEEVDQIMDGLMAVLDRQVDTGGSRTEMFAELLEMFAASAMATFISKTTEEIVGRSSRRGN